ncbi:MAG TPA: hypothetical protein VJ623_09005 [Holophagaceae bacterium]|nr:hypothetical protein [Holophagaceae bacterium]
MRISPILRWALCAALPLSAQIVDESFLRTADPAAIMAATVREARTLNGKDSRLLAEYGHALLAAGRREEGLDCFEAALRDDPTDSETRRLIAHAWFRLGDPEAAKRALVPLKVPSLRFDVGYERAARDLLDHAGSPEADAQMEVLYAKDRKAFRSFRSFAAYCRAVDPALAAKWYVRAAEKGEMELTLKAALDLIRAGHGEAADLVMTRYLESKPGSDSDCFEFARAAARHGLAPLVAKYLVLPRKERLAKPDARARAARANDLDALLEIGELALLAGDRPGAEEAFELVRPRIAADPEHQAALARIWVTAGHREEALKALEPFKDAALKHENALKDAAYVYLDLGFPEVADGLMERSQIRTPQGGDDWLEFGEAALDAGHAELAAKWLVRPDPGRKAKEHLGLAAVRILDLGHPEAADRVMEVAYRLDPADWPNCCEFGRAAIRNGHRALAAKYFYRAVDRNPLSERMWNEIALAFAEQGKGLRLTYRLD